MTKITFERRPGLLDNPRFKFAFENKAAFIEKGGPDPAEGVKFIQFAPRNFYTTTMKKEDSLDNDIVQVRTSTSGESVVTKNGDLLFDLGVSLVDFSPNQSTAVNMWGYYDLDYTADEDKKTLVPIYNGWFDFFGMKFYLRKKPVEWISRADQYTRNIRIDSTGVLLEEIFSLIVPSNEKGIGYLSIPTLEEGNKTLLANSLLWMSKTTAIGCTYASWDSPAEHHEGACWAIYHESGKIIWADDNFRSFTGYNIPNLDDRDIKHYLPYISAAVDELGVENTSHQFRTLSDVYKKIKSATKDFTVKIEDISFITDILNQLEGTDLNFLTELLRENVLIKKPIVFYPEISEKREIAARFDDIDEYFQFCDPTHKEFIWNCEYDMSEYKKTAVCGIGLEFIKYIFNLNVEDVIDPSDFFPGNQFITSVNFEDGGSLGVPFQEIRMYSDRNYLTVGDLESGNFNIKSTQTDTFQFFRCSTNVPAKVYYERSGKIPKPSVSSDDVMVWEDVEFLGGYHMRGTDDDLDWLEDFWNFEHSKKAGLEVADCTDPLYLLMLDFCEYHSYFCQAQGFFGDTEPLVPILWWIVENAGTMVDWYPSGKENSESSWDYMSIPFLNLLRHVFPHVLYPECFTRLDSWKKHPKLVEKLRTIYDFGGFPESMGEF